MTAQRWGIVTTGGLALASSVLSLGAIVGAWHLTADAVSAVNLVLVNAVALAGALLVKPPASSGP